jgi:sulfur relay protein TusB/DsrH
LSKPINGVAIYALMPDMQARGIDVARCYKHIQYVDYAGFVDLVEHNNPVRSCY